MPETDKLIQQLYELLAEQRKLLEGRLTEQIAFQYKEREKKVRELFQLLADGNRRGK